MDDVKDYVDFILNEVSDERIEDLFEEMGIQINLNKSWEYEDEDC